MSMTHGIEMQESATDQQAAVKIQDAMVVFGRAAVNKAADPSAYVNEPYLATSSTEAQLILGYSDDFRNYELSQTMYITQTSYPVDKVVYVNVLNPAKHRKPIPETTLEVVDGRARVPETGVLPKELVVKTVGDDGITLAVDDDYMTEWDGDTLVITLAEDGAAATATSIQVSGYAIDPSMVKASDIVGGVDPNTGNITGIELVRKVYSKFGVLPTVLIAPGWSQDPDVGIALAAKAAEINSVMRAFTFLDLDTNKARKWQDCKDVKESSGFTSNFAEALWPMVKIGSKIVDHSAFKGPMVMSLDADNDGIPYMSPSNKVVGVTGLCLADGTEITLDQDQAGSLNEMGVSTMIRMNGWRTWGNYTCGYPGTLDPKDMWTCCRRMFNYETNTFILQYFNKVDQPISKLLIESIVDSENYRIKALAAQGKWAGGSIQYLSADNEVSQILSGKIKFRISIAPYPPAQHIVGVLSFDTDLLMEDLAAAA